MGGCAVKVEVIDGDGTEHTYIVTFPSEEEAQNFLEDLAGVAHLKSVIEVPSEDVAALAPRWTTFTVSRYSGGARYSMAEKWMGAQEILA